MTRWKNIVLVSLLLLSGLYVLTTTSCNSDMPQQLQSKPTAFGNLNGIVVIADDIVWEGAVGDSFRKLYEGAYPLMPAPEPIFDVRHFTPDEMQINLSRKELRTYVVLANLQDTESPTTQLVESTMGEEKIRRYRELNDIESIQIAKDKWAHNQVMIYLLGLNTDDLIARIQENFSAVAGRINEHDQSQIKARTYLQGIHHGHGSQIENKYGLSLTIPDGFQQAESDGDFLWLRKDQEAVTFNLMFDKISYEDASQLTVENLLAIRNRIGKKYVSGATPGSHMVVNDEDLPLFDYVLDIHGNYAIELRGVWELTEDFVGGPFFSWLILNESRGELIFVDAFVLAPGESKRDLMQQLEYIVKNGKVGVVE